MTIETGTTNHTIWLDENGKQHFPCRCGKTHTGHYACEDYLHHECLHETELVDMGHRMVICMDCGKTWTVEK